jgi:hypothetical protein
VGNDWKAPSERDRERNQVHKAPVAVTRRQDSLAAKIEARADLTDHEREEAAQFLRRAPDPSPLAGLGKRNRLIREYFKKWLWDAPSQRAARIRFLLDLRHYVSGEYRHHKISGQLPKTLDSRRADLWEILAEGPPPPETEEGIRLILR